MVINSTARQYGRYNAKQKFQKIGSKSRNIKRLIARYWCIFYFHICISKYTWKNVFSLFRQLTIGINFTYIYPQDFFEKLFPGIMIRQEINVIHWKYLNRIMSATHVKCLTPNDFNNERQVNTPVNYYCLQESSFGVTHFSIVTVDLASERYFKQK